jgi:hypothetical protein
LKAFEVEVVVFCSSFRVKLSVLDRQAMDCAMLVV